MRSTCGGPIPPTFRVRPAYSRRHDHEPQGLRLRDVQRLQAVPCSKLQNIVSLPGISCPTSAGCNPAKTGPAVADRYAEYQDYLVSTQTSHTSQTGGNWGAMLWSCCGSMPNEGPTAIAELILAPVALVQPYPGVFSTVGLSPATDSNPVGTDHTVTATVEKARTMRRSPERPLGSRCSPADQMRARLARATPPVVSPMLAAT